MFLSCRNHQPPFRLHITIYKGGGGGGGGGGGFSIKIHVDNEGLIGCWPWQSVFLRWDLERLVAHPSMFGVKLAHSALCDVGGQGCSFECAWFVFLLVNLNRIFGL